jgi:hypothetical protein
MADFQTNFLLANVEFIQQYLDRLGYDRAWLEFGFLTIEELFAGTFHGTSLQ